MTDITTFNFNYFEAVGDERNTVTTVLVGDKAEYLPSILEGFMRFLVSAGFTYLTGDVERVSEGYLIRDKV